MTHPMKDYWQHAFANYKVGSEKYSIAEMPDPILSANFIDLKDTQSEMDCDYFNLILKDYKGPALEFSDFRVRNDFFLGVLKIDPGVIESKQYNYKFIDLAEALENGHHLKLLEDGFCRDFQFLKKLETFLPNLNANYKVGLLEDSEGNALASITIGVAGDCAKLISGVVHSKYQNQKLSRELRKMTHILACSQGATRAFFWTKSLRLLRYADQVDRYFIYTK